jgi:hypothetical protein
MKIIGTLFLSAALLPSPAVKGQQTTQPQPQAAGQHASPAEESFEDAPGFKRLSPEQQDQVRKMMANLHKAMEETRRQLEQEQHQPATRQTPQYNQTPAPPAAGAGCNATAPKKPGWLEKHVHIKPPASVRSQINKTRAGIERKTGISPDVLSPDEIAKQKAANPCPPVTPTAPPTTVAPAPPAKQ